MKFFLLTLAFCLIAVNCTFIPAEDDDGTETYADDVRKNEVVISVYAGISDATAIVGKETLENLVLANAKNGEILDTMYSLFTGLNRDLAWHLTFQTTSYGVTPTAYVYYLFDRNNTELLIAGYKRCA